MHEDGIYTRRSCELYKGILLHDRDVWNKQYTRVGATLQIGIGSYSSHSFGDLLREMSDKFESQHPLTPSIWSDVRVDI
jgi:hypothetical protein